MTKLQALALGNYIRGNVNHAHEDYDHMNIIYQDLKNMWMFLSEYSTVFLNTNTDNNITIKDGLDGDSLLASKLATEGFLYNTIEARQKTISEALLELYTNINTQVTDNNVGTEISQIKDVIGLEKFIDGVQSSDISLIYDINKLITNVEQIIADIFNRDTTIGDPVDDLAYSLNDNGYQTQQYSIKDLLMRLVYLHGKESYMSHDSVTNSQIWAVSIPSSELIHYDNEKYTTVFATGTDIISDLSTAQKFYNPYGVGVNITGLSIQIDSNTLDEISSITLYINNQITLLNISVAAMGSGQFKTLISDLELNPSDYLQIKIDTTQARNGYISITNVALIVEIPNQT